MDTLSYRDASKNRCKNQFLAKIKSDVPKRGDEDAEIFLQSIILRVIDGNLN